MDAPYLFLQMLELAACPNNIIEEVPNLRLKEILSQALSIGDLGPQDKLVVVVAQLSKKERTFAIPELPHMPTASKEYLSGSSKTYLLSVSLIWFRVLSQSL